MPGINFQLGPAVALLGFPIHSVGRLGTAWLYTSCIEIL